MNESKLYGRTELRKAELKRRSDARRLFEGGVRHARAAAYLAGYAVECRLKAMAMEIYDVHNLAELALKWGVADRDVYTHRLEVLLQRLPFWDRFRRDPVWNDFIRHVNRWKPEWRYEGGDLPLEKAQVFLVAVDRVLRWLGSNG